MVRTTRSTAFNGFLLFSIFVYSSYAKSLYTFSAYRVSCEQIDPKVAYNITCSTRSLNRTVKAHTIRVALYPNLTFSDIYVHISYYQRINNAYRRSIGEYDENFCKFLDGTVNSLLIKILWPYLKKKSNLGDRCPFSGFINVTDLVFEDKYLPPALPEGQARLDIQIRNGSQSASLGTVRFFIEVKPKGAARLDF